MSQDSPIPSPSPADQPAASRQGSRPGAHYQAATFALSVARLSQLPADEGHEVAFAGRSNAGKSSALNRLTGQKGLARTSKTPGRTQLINFFTLDDQRRLVDLPGYGYAKVSAEIKHRWQDTMEQYLATRQCLSGLVLLMDVRHPLKDLDRQLLAWCWQVNMPVHVTLTKADKLTRGAGQNVLLEVQRDIAACNPPPGLTSIQLFSATTSDPRASGLEQLWRVLDGWMDYVEPGGAAHSANSVRKKTGKKNPGVPR